MVVSTFYPRAVLTEIDRWLPARHAPERRWERQFCYGFAKLHITCKLRFVNDFDEGHFTFHAQSNLRLHQISLDTGGQRRENAHCQRLARGHGNETRHSQGISFCMEKDIWVQEFGLDTVQFCLTMSLIRFLGLTNNVRHYRVICQNPLGVLMVFLSLGLHLHCFVEWLHNMFTEVQFIRVAVQA